MPDAIVTADQLSKDEDDFGKIFSEISDKSDEEIKEAESNRSKKPDAEAGEPTKDQVSIGQQDNTTDNTSATDAEPGQVTPDPATGASADHTDWKAKAESLEAELSKERQRTSSWDGRIKAANKKSESLAAEVKMLREKLDNMPTQPTKEEQSDQDVLDKFKETFPELVEFSDVIDRKIRNATKPALDKEPKPSPSTDDLDPEPASSDDTTTVDKSAVCDMVEVRKIHKDVDEAVASGKIVTWINTQPDYMRPALENVFYGANGFGSTKQVIDLLNNFKKQTGWMSDLLKRDSTKQDKLNSMLEAEGDSGGPVDNAGPDKNDFDTAAKEAGL